MSPSAFNTFCKLQSGIFPKRNGQILAKLQTIFSERKEADVHCVHTACVIMSNYVSPALISVFKETKERIIALFKRSFSIVCYYALMRIVQSILLFPSRADRVDALNILKKKFPHSCLNTTKVTVFKWGIFKVEY